MPAWDGRPRWGGTPSRGHLRRRRRTWCARWESRGWETAGRRNVKGHPHMMSAQKHSKYADKQYRVGTQNVTQEMEQRAVIPFPVWHSDFWIPTWYMDCVDRGGRGSKNTQNSWTSYIEAPSHVWACLDLSYTVNIIIDVAIEALPFTVTQVTVTQYSYSDPGFVPKTIVLY